MKEELEMLEEEHKKKIEEIGDKHSVAKACLIKSHVEELT